MALMHAVEKPNATGLVELDPQGDEPPAVPRLSVVVPAYHVGARIVENIGRLTSALDATGLSWEVIVVVDGDVDTYRAALPLSSPSVTVVGYAVNRGKGFALRYGMSLATGGLVTFIDSDMEVGPEEIGRMAQLLSLYDADVVVGSKRHPLSRVQYPVLRRFQSMCFQLLVRLLFRVRVRDTQTGLKLMRREVAVVVLDAALVKRFAFDVELLALARHFGYARIIEAPVTIDYQFSSTTNLRAVFFVLVDTLAVFYRLRIRRWYDRSANRGRVALHLGLPLLFAGMSPANGADAEPAIVTTMRADRSGR
jgi:glycosyltransferase involved in cell wall biosynthesis